MESNQVAMRKDLLFIYEALYTTVNREGNSLFDKKLIKKLKYTPEQISQLLELNKPNSDKSEVRKKKVESTANIKHIDELRDFY